MLTTVQPEEEKNDGTEQSVAELEAGDATDT
jgi:hypothetical protein